MPCNHKMFCASVVHQESVSSIYTEYTLYRLTPPRFTTYSNDVEDMHLGSPNQLRARPEVWLYRCVDMVSDPSKAAITSWKPTLCTRRMLRLRYMARGRSTSEHEACRWSTGYGTGLRHWARVRVMVRVRATGSGRYLIISLGNTGNILSGHSVTSFVL